MDRHVKLEDVTTPEKLFHMLFGLVMTGIRPGDEKNEIIFCIAHLKLKPFRSHIMPSGIETIFAKACRKQFFYL